MELLKYISNKFQKDILVNKITADIVSCNIPSAMMPGLQTINVEIESTDISACHLINGQDNIVEMPIGKVSGTELIIQQNITLTDICILEIRTDYNRILEDYKYTIKLTASTIELFDISRKLF
jgi:hypothetical protein